MASQGVSGFMNNLLQGPVIAEGAKLRVLDPKSGKRFNVKIKEKRPKWYQLCFNWWLRKLNIKKRHYEYCSTIGEPDPNTIYENMNENMAYRDPSPTLSHQSHEAETEVVVHVSCDSSGSNTRSNYDMYNIPSLQREEVCDFPQEDIYSAAETTRGEKPESHGSSDVIKEIVGGLESDGPSIVINNSRTAEYQQLFCDPCKPEPGGFFDVKPLPSSRKEKVEDAVNGIAHEAPENKDLSEKGDDYYERVADKRYKELACLPCKSLEIDWVLNVEPRPSPRKKVGNNTNV